MHLSRSVHSVFQRLCSSPLLCAAHTTLSLTQCALAFHSFIINVRHPNCKTRPRTFRSVSLVRGNKYLKLYFIDYSRRARRSKEDVCCADRYISFTAKPSNHTPCPPSRRRRRLRLAHLRARILLRSAFSVTYVCVRVRNVCTIITFCASWGSAFPSAFV